MFVSLYQPSYLEFRLLWTPTFQSTQHLTRLQTVGQSLCQQDVLLSSLLYSQLIYVAYFPSSRVYLYLWSKCVCSWTNQDSSSQMRRLFHLLADKMSTSDFETSPTLLCPKSWLALHHLSLPCMTFEWSLLLWFECAVIRIISCRTSWGLMSCLPSHRRQ